MAIRQPRIQEIIPTDLVGQITDGQQLDFGCRLDDRPPFGAGRHDHKLLDLVRVGRNQRGHDRLFSWSGRKPAGRDPHSLRPIGRERVQEEHMQHPPSRAELFDVPSRKSGGILSWRGPDVDDLPHFGNQAVSRKSAAGRSFPFHLRNERPLITFGRQECHDAARQIGFAVAGNDGDRAVST